MRLKRIRTKKSRNKKKLSKRLTSRTSSVMPPNGRKKKDWKLFNLKRVRKTNSQSKKEKRTKEKINKKPNKRRNSRFPFKLMHYSIV